MLDWDWLSTNLDWMVHWWVPFRAGIVPAADEPLDISRETEWLRRRNLALMERQADIVRKRQAAPFEFIGYAFRGG